MLELLLNQSQHKLPIEQVDYSISHLYVLFTYHFSTNVCQYSIERIIIHVIYAIYLATECTCSCDHSIT